MKSSLLAIATVGMMTLNSTAFALCSQPLEEGWWKNYDPETRSITYAYISFQCQDVILNGQPPAGDPYSVYLWGQCHPNDCYWGRSGATRDSADWIRTTYYHGYATRYVWIKAYAGSVDWLRVYIWTDFHDGRTDYASDDWFIRL